MKVTLGGDRIGSGNKQKIALRNYERSTHNMSQKFASSLAPGILYPFLKIPALRGDSFEIDLEAAARTIPTKGPLFGSYKMQVDIFQCPVRLYQGILHNNPIKIGLKMSQVKFPKITFEADDELDENAGKFSDSCLAKYLGISGIGRSRGDMISGLHLIKRKFNAIPFLAYYDIFKNYYSNKQEENAYCIVPKTQSVIQVFLKAIQTINTLYGNIEKDILDKEEIKTKFDTNGIEGEIKITGFNLKPENIKVEFRCTITYTENQENKETEFGIFDEMNDFLTLIQQTGGEVKSNESKIEFEYNTTDIKNYIIDNFYQFHTTASNASIKNNELECTITRDKYVNIFTGFALEQFALENLDEMRRILLSYNALGYEVNLSKNNSDIRDLHPYDWLVETHQRKTNDTVSYNYYSHNGLVVKTYQSDLYNNWVNTEWIDGENGIADVTKIGTDENGNFTIDQLNLSEKLYNMLNRIAISGGTYEDWQDAVYTESPKRHMESPMYLGGMSCEVVFEEIIQTAPAEGTELGTLGGRGILLKRKGGNVSVHVDEASYIIGIVSLTPRIYYSQGNDWDMTELDTMDDLHKPALDGIGFQDLMCEQMAWWDTIVDDEGTIQLRRSAGKVPAWINYMTAVDKCYGDFANEDGKGFMILNRNYEDAGSDDGIADVTTYIDPKKYNYAFAYTELDSQNFWVQIDTKIRARRLMSAKQIPNI